MQSGVVPDRHAQVKAAVAVLPDRCPTQRFIGA